MLWGSIPLLTSMMNDTGYFIDRKGAVFSCPKGMDHALYAVKIFKKGLTQCLNSGIVRVRFYTGNFRVCGIECGKKLTPKQLDAIQGIYKPVHHACYCIGKREDVLTKERPLCWGAVEMKLKGEENARML